MRNSSHTMNLGYIIIFSYYKLKLLPKWLLNVISMSFIDEDTCSLVYPYEDPLVVILKVIKKAIIEVLIDTINLMSMLFKDIMFKMNLNR